MVKTEKVGCAHCGAMVREDKYLAHMIKVHPKDLSPDVRKEVNEREKRRKNLANARK